MKKRGDITSQTPGVGKPMKTAFDKGPPRQPESDVEASKIGDHPLTRASDEIAKASSKKKS